MALQRQKHWLIDTIDGDAARLETELGELVHVARSLLPEGARAGMVVRVTTAEGDDARPVALALDPAATAAAMARSEAQLRRPRGEDTPGDIAL
jgi:hypothetical protein